MAAKRVATRSTPRRNREAEVLQAAIEVFWKKGYAAASIQDVADRVGVLKGSLYHYIDSKEDLLFQIFNESHEQASAIVEEVAALDAPAIERLRIYVERYLLWYLTHLERVSLYLSEWRYLTGARRATVMEQRRTYEGFVRNLILAAQAEGDVPEGLNAKYASFFILGALNGVPTWYRRNGPDPPEEIANAYAAMALEVLGPRPARGRRRAARAT
jgi:TetR/AcrR family transcriptional regulator, cholesterol catabolism regulator